MMGNTYKGNVYEIGKAYLFGAGDRYHVLTGINHHGEYPFQVVGNAYTLIKEIPSSDAIGKITPPPVELVDGQAYMFDWVDRPFKGSVGVYSMDAKRFYFPMGHITAEACTNIRKMVVAP